MNWYKESRDLPGGLADKKKDTDFDRKQLDMGVEVELEHTNDKELSKDITKDHLEEFPNYYTELAKMEDKLKKKETKELMNWYKDAGLKDFAKGFFGLTIPAIVMLLGGNALDIERRIQTDPQGLAQDIAIRQTQETTDPNSFQQPTPEPNIEPVQEVAPDPNVTEQPQSAEIDLNKIWEMESSKGTDPNMGKSGAGARGHFQFMEKTWNDMIQRMGKDWDWYNDSMDFEKSKAVADFYLNKRIPQMLDYYDITDNVDNRLGAYNWGIGVLLKKWNEFGEDWKQYAPEETQGYLTKYYE